MMQSRNCFLRASGGVSIGMLVSTLIFWFSPRKRRCFYGRLKFKTFNNVFSAQAEVFLSDKCARALVLRFLRASGGVSKLGSRWSQKTRFSPRKRRCFFRRSREACRWRVFSAQAEVFLIVSLTRPSDQSFLRASGGVSLKVCRGTPPAGFSPRKRRCFYVRSCHSCRP